MESSGDHGRGGLKPLPPWTTTTPAVGHNFSLAAAGCFPWPPQMRSPQVSSSCYTCGYCRREFRSAQALGGHMNVHRRDRARLRQCCSAAASAAHGPSSVPSSGLVTAHQQHSRAPPLPNLNFSPSSHRAAGEPVIYSFFSATTTTSAAAAASNKAALEVSLELGIGVCGTGSSRGGGVAVEEDGLDLELRLGCAWE